MEKELVHYEQALALKELGFDEPCFAYYIQEPYYNSKKELKYKKPTYYEISGWKNSDKLVSAKEDSCIYITLPTYSQAFRWFREKYNLKGFISPVEYLDGTDDTYHWCVYNHCNSGNEQLTHKEAELECLKKLIELCKKQL